MSEEEKEVQKEEEFDYRYHIKDMLGKVSKGEKVFDENKPNKVEKLHSVKGVKEAIKGIFNDFADDDDTQVMNESIEDEIEELEKNSQKDEESPKELSPSSFEEVTSKESVPDVFELWETAQKYLHRIGRSGDDGQTYVKRTVEGRDDEPSTITAQLVKHKDYESKPFMKVSFDENDDSTPAELAIPYIENVGIKVNKDTLYETPEGNFVYFEFDV